MGLFRKKDEDDFKSMSTQRRTVEDEHPWFEGDDDAPDLDVETGIGSNLRRSGRRRRR
ncbi:MAG TPA: hypothetical protein VFU14_17610 [Acidimicrobiales bacterium]|nr:hypothetical protein [Acidimicrobiales bacterium]